MSSNTLELSNVRVLVDSTGQPYFDFCEVTVTGIVGSTYVSVKDRNRNGDGLIATLTSDSPSVLLVSGEYLFVPNDDDDYKFTDWESYPTCCTTQSDNSILMSLSSELLSEIQKMSLVAKFSNAEQGTPKGSTVTFTGVSNCSVLVEPVMSGTMEMQTMQFDQDTVLNISSGTEISIEVTPYDGFELKDLKFNGTAQQPRLGKYYITVPAGNSLVNIVVEAVEAQTCNLTITGIPDNAWKVVVIGIYDGDSTHYEITGANPTIEGITKDSELRFELKNIADSYFYCVEGLPSSMFIDRDQTINVTFSKIEVTIGGLGHATNTVIPQDIIYNSTLEITVMPDETYYLAYYTIDGTSFNGDATGSPVTITIQDIKESHLIKCYIYLKEPGQDTTYYIGNPQQKHYRFKIQYKNAQTTPITLDWFPTVYEYGINE